MPWFMYLIVINTDIAGVIVLHVMSIIIDILVDIAVVCVSQIL